MAKIDEAVERVKAFLAAKEENHQKFPTSIAALTRRVAIIGTFDPVEQKFIDHQLLVEDLHTILEHLGNTDG